MSQENLCLEDLGWNSFFEGHFSNLHPLPALAPARVVEELKGFHRVRCEGGEYLAEVSGKMRYLASRRDALPAVGDWVVVAPCADKKHARIECILPRRTKLSRKMAGRTQSEQIVAANVDVVFVVSSLNREFNPRRIERYLAVVWESGARPVILLNKSDLCPDAAERAVDVESIALGVPVHLLSATWGKNLDAVRRYLGRGETAAFVGSSGVGKTTIISALAETQSLRVGAVREADDRGRHTTSSRQMIFLTSGGILIDPPGMRELQLWETTDGVAQAFEDIATLASGCRFRDCSHSGEPGCAVEVAILNGGLERERLESHRKLEAELRFQERKLDPRMAREVKEKWKRIHKAMRRDKPEPL
jgi:ribosome biogenesis GTPase / thiamine phosphate phosphatase